MFPPHKSGSALTVAALCVIPQIEKLFHNERFPSCLPSFSPSASHSATLRHATPRYAMHPAAMESRRDWQSVVPPLYGPNRVLTQIHRHPVLGFPSSALHTLRCEVHMRPRCLSCRKAREGHVRGKKQISLHCSWTLKSWEAVVARVWESGLALWLAVCGRVFVKWGGTSPQLPLMSVCVCVCVSLFGVCVCV